jgi:hypothetical protein
VDMGAPFSLTVESTSASGHWQSHSLSWESRVCMGGTIGGGYFRHLAHA